MEHMTPKGLRQGYFCAVCGESCNLYATGHGMGKCQPNPERVKVLQELNSNGAGNSLPKEPTPTPSITVGTQVRLTGVVTRIPGDPDVEDPEFPETEYRVQIVGAVGPEGETGVWFRDATLKNLEVIRQPFKRGEVVYLSGWPRIETCSCRVLEDEREGKVLLVGEVEGSSASYVEAGAYERRND